MDALRNYDMQKACALSVLYLKSNVSVIYKTITDDIDLLLFPFPNVRTNKSLSSITALTSIIVHLYIKITVMRRYLQRFRRRVRLDDEGAASLVLSTILIYRPTFPPSMSTFSSCPSISHQSCELHVAGYRFSVLSSAFVVHRGFKIQGEFHARKDEENKRNRVLFRSFKEGLKTKYPSSNRRCWNEMGDYTVYPASICSWWNQPSAEIIDVHFSYFNQIKRPVRLSLPKMS